jgi:translocation protein SEC66
MASLLVPVFYLLIVFGGLFIFSYYYRKRLAGWCHFSFTPRRSLNIFSATTLDPYFPPHEGRNAYITLLQKSDPPASDALLKSALLRRAIGDVNRLLRIREDKPALQQLILKGLIGDDLWNSLLAAEKDLEIEIQDVVSEANSFVEGWGSMIFQTASEMIENEKMRAIFEQTQEARQRLSMQHICFHFRFHFSSAITVLQYNVKSKTATPSSTLLSAPSSTPPVSRLSTTSSPSSHDPVSASDGDGSRGKPVRVSHFSFPFTQVSSASQLGKKAKKRR